MYEEERNVIASDLGRINDCDRKAFESWNCETQAAVVLGSRYWRNQEKVAVGRVGTFLGATVGGTRTGRHSAIAPVGKIVEIQCLS